MSWVSIAVAGIGAVGTIAASSSASNANRDATRAASDASAANIALARETRDDNEALYSGDMAGGNRAQSYLDALTYGSSGGSGSYGSTSGGGDWQAYLEQNPDVLAAAQAEGRDPIEYAQAHYQTYGQAEGRQLPQLSYGGTGESGALTREDVMGQIEAQPLYQWNEEDQGARNDLVDQAYADETGVYGEQRGVAKDFATQGLRDRNAYLDDDLATRRGYTDTAINDRRQLNDINNAKARDRIAGALGVNGQVGKAARASAEAANELDLEFADTERNWRNADYDPYATGRMGAYDTWYDDYGGADDRYYGDVAGATNRRSAGRQANYDTYAGGRNAAYGAYVDDLSDRVGAGRSARGTIASGNNSYASTVSGANTSRAQTYAESANNRAAITGQAWADAGRLAGNAYGSYSYNRRPTTQPASYDTSGYDDYTANYSRRRPSTYASTSYGAY